MFLHNVLPPGLTEDVLHCFIAWPRVAAARSFLSLRVVLLAGGTADRLLLFFAWPKVEFDLSAALALVVAFVELAWSTLDGPDSLQPILVRTRVGAASGPLPSAAYRCYRCSAQNASQIHHIYVYMNLYIIHFIFPIESLSMVHLATLQ
jgi:hypothetical protein